MLVRFKARINHPFPAAADTADTASSSSSSAVKSLGDGDGWPPPQPMGGMPCGVYPSQFAVQALYANLKDGGLAALKVMTSDVENSWVAMLKQGATMTMEMWNAEEKPNTTWSHPWASSPAFLVVSIL